MRCARDWPLLLGGLVMSLPVLHAWPGLDGRTGPAVHNTVQGACGDALQGQQHVSPL